MDILRQAPRGLLVEFRSLAVLDFRIGPIESFSKNFNVQSVLFDEAMNGFMNERIDAIVIAALDLNLDGSKRFPLPRQPS